MIAQRSQTVSFRPVAKSLPVRRTVSARASASKSNGPTVKAPVVVSAAVVSAVAMSALVPAAQAAQEAFQLSEGEPLIVQLGWSAVAASFSFSLALVVWGRSGM